MRNLFKTLMLSLTLTCALQVQAVNVKNMPTNKIQPNGDTIHIFVTGDEFYHRYHDVNNYTIVQNKAGYWVYAVADKAGSIIPTQHLVNSVSPATLGLTPGIAISNKEYLQRRKAWEIPEQYKSNMPKTDGRNHGNFCNLVIFIRFADDTNYARSLSSVDQMFSDSTRNTSVSVYNYFKQASYNQLFIRTLYAPTPDGNRIRSYQTPHSRSYYMPYTDNNTNGYRNYQERTEREFELFAGCIDWLNDSCPVPSDYVLDYNNDGYIDNINFVVTGTYTGWSDLLWPHKWNLYSHEKYINGKRVSTFNLALEGSGNDYFGPSTFSHEMFHSLGAPDLYRYGAGTDVAPVGIWDLMASNSKPPQHSTAYIKQKYGNWIDTIPLVTEPGIYTLHSVGDTTPGLMALRFPSSDPDQFYVVEYRDNTENFETTIPGKGLLIYRIDTRFVGNSNWDGADNFDEVWVFRPNSTSSFESGFPAEAYFSPSRNRSEFTPGTNPYPHLSDGTRDFSFAITNIGTPGNTCTFRYTNRPVPANLNNGRITSSTATLTWEGNGQAYRVGYRLQGTEDYTFRTSNSTNITLTGLEANQLYEWTVRALYDRSSEAIFADSTRLAVPLTFHTELCNNAVIDTVGWYTILERTGMPFTSNENYNYSQQIYLASEMNYHAKTISTITLHYAHTTDLEKSNCTIYMANTTVANFDDGGQAVPFSELTQVYAGDLSFSRGWNEIVLDNPFYYNGVDNLVVAIDDNSGEPSRAGHKFYLHETENRRAIVYYDNNKNPDPQDDTIKGTINRSFQRCNMKFTGCPIDADHVYACILSDNPNFGNVSGEGLYDVNETITIQAVPIQGHEFTIWSDGVFDNPRQLVLSSDTLIIAYFDHNLAISPAEAETGYVVISRQLNVIVEGAGEQPVAIYDIMGRPIATAAKHHQNPVSFKVPQSGIYLLKVGNNKPAKIYVR